MHFWSVFYFICLKLYKCPKAYHLCRAFNHQSLFQTMHQVLLSLFFQISLFYTPKWRNHFWHIHPLFVAFLHRVRFLLIGKYPFPQHWLFKNGFPCRRLTDRSTGKIGFFLFFFFSFFVPCHPSWHFASVFSWVLFFPRMPASASLTVLFQRTKGCQICNLQCLPEIKIEMKGKR